LDRGETRDKATPIVHIIKSEIDRLERLVREFLAFAKPTPFQPRPVDVSALLEQVVELIGPEAEGARISIEVAVGSPVPAVMGDAERLRQVVLNLTRNAFEALQETGGQLILRARAAKSSVEVDVEDNGPGFSDGLPVFDAFFTTKDQGTGLGLSLVHRIVSDHGGTIRVQSRPGCTCFTVTLPRATPRP
jgi:signal transduction histidine kinase